MDRFAILREVMWLPKDGLTTKDIARIKKATTVKWTDYGETIVNTFKTFEDVDGWLGIPRRYGMEVLPSLNGILDYEDRTVTGGDAAWDRASPVQLFPYQEPFVEGLMECTEDHYDFIGKAATGKGKTVMGTEVARRLGYKTLVIVDQENLIPQWAEDTWKGLYRIPEDQIGLIQSGTCDYEGKTVVIAMLQSLISREDSYPEALYSEFGTVIFDEVHAQSAEVYHRVLEMFPATVRFGLTATPRTDALRKLSDLHLGKGADVVLGERHNESVVRFIQSDTVYSWYANISPKDGRFLKEIAEDARRNRLIAEAVQWLYDSGRDVLVIGARIEQLESLMALCELRGIPKDEMGLYCGYRNEWKYAKDPHPERRPSGLVKGAVYTPVKLQQVSKKNSRQVLDKVKDEAKVLFATYGMFAKGVNVPRLSAGIDCTPRSKVQQVHGRILRSAKNKKTPIWVTIRDVNSFRAEYQFTKRIREYQASNAEVFQWQIGKGVRRVDVSRLLASVEKRVARLKQVKIVTSVDGNNMLVIPDTGIR